MSGPTRHRTKAGPIRHEPLPFDGKEIRGRLWSGWRNYGWRYFSVPARLGAKWKRRLYEKRMTALLLEIRRPAGNDFVHGKGCRHMLQDLIQ